MNQYFDFLTKSGYHLSDVGRYWRTCAHYRGGKNPTALSIDKHTGFFRDFATGDRGPFQKLVKLIGGEIEGMSFDEHDRYILKEKIRIQKVFPPEVLKTLVPHYDLFLDKGISKETLTTFQAGLDHSGKLANRICFPIYNNKGQIIGFDGRWHKNEVPNKFTAKWKKNGRKNDWTFPCHLNREIMLREKEVILVESIGDELALWDTNIQTGTVIFGTELSAKLLIYLIGLNPDRIIIATNNEEDNDSIGNLAAVKIQKKLAKHFAEEKIKICLPTKKDLGIMTKPEIIQWYESSRARF